MDVFPMSTPFPPFALSLSKGRSERLPWAGYRRGRSWLQEKAGLRQAQPERLRKRCQNFLFNHDQRLIELDRLAVLDQDGLHDSSGRRDDRELGRAHV